MISELAKESRDREVLIAREEYFEKTGSFAPNRATRRRAARMASRGSGHTKASPLKKKNKRERRRGSK